MSKINTTSPLKERDLEESSSSPTNLNSIRRATSTVQTDREKLRGLAHTNVNRGNTNERFNLNMSQTNHNYNANITTTTTSGHIKERF